MTRPRVLRSAQVIRRFTVLLTDREMRYVAKAAKKEGRSQSAWARLVLLRQLVADLNQDMGGKNDAARTTGSASAESRQADA